MHLTLTVSIAMTAIAVALPQGPGGSRAVLGWCVSDFSFLHSKPRLMTQKLIICFFFGFRPREFQDV